MSEPALERTLWRNARIATCDEVDAGFRERRAGNERRSNRVGRRPNSTLPVAFARLIVYGTHDLGGRWITPALVDCHTHLIYAGNRAAEFAERLRGV